MTELEQQLRELEIAWPATPALAPALAPRRRRLWPLAVALAAVAIAFAVPPARSAILRFFHLGGVTVERVGTLPAAEQRALGTGLGTRTSPAEAAALLGGPVLLPPGAHGPLYARDTVVSTLLSTPEPVLLSELRGDSYLLKKVATIATGVSPANVRPGVEALWISGGQHVVFFMDEPPRLAGNVLLWTHGELTLRLEGPKLTQAQAERLARKIDGT